MAGHGDVEVSGDLTSRQLAIPDQVQDGAAAGTWVEGGKHGSPRQLGLPGRFSVLDYPRDESAHVNFIWGQVVGRLKAYAETGQPQPFFPPAAVSA
jgi:hypothetical protein